MSFCKTFHTLLGYSVSDDRRHFSIPSTGGGLILIAGKFQKPANVVEASAVGKLSGERSSRNRLYDDGGGFLTCTESLGFESSDEMLTEGEKEQEKEREKRVEEDFTGEKSIRRARVRRPEVKFPPPLPGLDRNGRPRSFLRAERKDGRFRLTEVMIDRPEFLRANRENGRLRLQLVKPIEEEVAEETKEEEEEEKAAAEEEDQEEEQQKKGESVRQRHFRFQRCQEQRNHLPIWNNPRCVTTT